MHSRRVKTVLAAVSASFLVLIAAGRSARVISQRTSLVADAGDPAMTTRGAHIYWRQCGPCHGNHLQGQPFWRLVDEDAGRRAPALDLTGRAWGRSDADLFHVVKYGAYPDRVSARESQMPAFAGRLDDRDVLSVVAFVKARWPISLRSLQALRNPGRSGMPADVGGADWRLPATCFSQDVAAKSLRLSQPVARLP